MSESCRRQCSDPLDTNATSQPTSPPASLHHPTHALSCSFEWLQRTINRAAVQDTLCRCRPPYSRTRSTSITLSLSICMRLSTCLSYLTLATDSLYRICCLSSCFPSCSLPLSHTNPQPHFSCTLHIYELERLSHHRHESSHMSVVCT